MYDILLIKACFKEELVVCTRLCNLLERLDLLLADLFQVEGNCCISCMSNFCILNPPDVLEKFGKLDQLEALSIALSLFHLFTSL